jgi:GT2 family glycosyltransferase
MDLSIVIVSFNTKDLTLQSIESVVKKTRGIKYEIIVVDNGSKDGSVEKLKKLTISHQSLIILQNEENLGFAVANNQGAKKAKGKYLLFLNSDTLIKDNVLGEMVNWMDKYPKVGVASCALKNKDGSDQGTGGYSPTLLRVFSWMTIQDIPLVDEVIKPFHPLHKKSFSTGTRFYEKQRKLDWVSGAFMLIRKEAYQQVKAWDEKYFMYTEEVDLCYRIKKLGWEIWYLPDWSIIHLGGASSTVEFPILSEYKGVKRFYRKFYPKWQYPILRLLLRIGALGRIILFAILEGKETAKIYVKAFQQA